MTTNSFVRWLLLQHLIALMRNTMLNASVVYYFQKNLIINVLMPGIIIENEDDWSK